MLYKKLHVYFLGLTMLVSGFLVLRLLHSSSGGKRILAPDSEGKRVATRWRGKMNALPHWRGLGGGFLPLNQTAMPSKLYAGYAHQKKKPFSKNQLYFVYFQDKPSLAFEAEDYFDPKALERRVKSNLPLYDERDLPLNSRYVDLIRVGVDSIRYQLRWLNALSVSASAAQLSAISQWPFVSRIVPFGTYQSPAISKKMSYPSSEAKLDTLLSLVHAQLQLGSFEAEGYTGKGIRMAILDAGFKESDTHPALAYVRQQGHILHTYNFYEGNEEVYNHSFHGTEVLACVAGLRNGRQLGCGKDVEFLLARTEHERKEFAIEEDHWIAAAEWADRLGADIINSSVTFTDKRYTYQDMDGQKTAVSRAAAIAAQKGILIVCSMGNEGDSPWQYMGAPADSPEVLSVGGSMPILPMHIKFASHGPNFLGQLKPNISAPAYVVSTGKKGKYKIQAGTSYSSPLMAGFAACLMQMHPTYDRAQITNLIQKLGHYYPYYDYYLGYGIPQASRLFRDSIPEVKPTFELDYQADSVILHFDSEIMSKDSLLHPDGRVLYYHLEGPDGQLMATQFELLPNKTRHYFFLKNKALKGILRIWFEGYLYEKEVGEID